MNILNSRLLFGFKSLVVLKISKNPLMYLGIHTFERLTDIQGIITDILECAASRLIKNQLVLQVLSGLHPVILNLMFIYT